MSASADRLYALLPVVHRRRDADEGYPLRALLQVIAEQVNLVEADIGQLYENWFIETCQDWVVPYLGDLIGYRIVHEGGEPGDVSLPRGVARNRILIPRRDVANTIHDRRRKGTLAVLESLAGDVAGWPARAVEFYRRLAVAQSINHRRLDRGRTVDLRDGDALDRLDGPFDDLAHIVDVRRIISKRTLGRYNIPSVGVFVWRLRSYPVTQTPAYCFEEHGPNCYLFSVLGNDAQLFTRPRPDAPHPLGELDLPTPIRRRPFEQSLRSERHRHDYYGEDRAGEKKSLHIWVGSPREPGRPPDLVPVPPEQIVAADLTDWMYHPLPGQVAVDPVLGRIVFPPGQPRKQGVRQGVWVSYHYGFSAEIGGGEYARPLVQPSDHRLYLVGEGERFARIKDALDQWGRDQPRNAVIEITDSGVYVEQITISLRAKQTLQLRAADGKRPVIRLLDWQTSLPDNLSVRGEPGAAAWFTLDGLLITGRGVQIEGNIRGVTIRHSTLVPGWGLHCDCEPKRPTEPSLALFDAPACLTIEHSIVGGIQVSRDEVKEDPVLIRISDSIVDATRPDRVALGAPEGLCAYAALTIARSTVFGRIESHVIHLGENCLFAGLIRVARRQQGCLRFSYVTPGSRTPRRYECQPDLVESAVADRFNKGDISAEERDSLQDSERLRVEPEFNSTRYGTPTYCQLANTCATEITRGADDESEMGVFHDLYQPQRTANLRARLDEYTPVGMDAGIMYGS
jgi:hypothetical protein